MRAAHAIFTMASDASRGGKRKLIVVGIPKTMDTHPLGLAVLRFLSRSKRAPRPSFTCKRNPLQSRLSIVPVVRVRLRVCGGPHGAGMDNATMRWYPRSGHDEDPCAHVERVLRGGRPPLEPYGMTCYPRRQSADAADHIDDPQSPLSGRADAIRDSSARHRRAPGMLSGECPARLRYVRTQD